MEAAVYRFSVWLQFSSVGRFMRNSLWPFPLIETIHIFGMVVLVGSVSILDLRLLGLMLKEQPISKLTKRILPWAGVGLCIQLVTGFFLFATESRKLYFSLPFRFKMLMLVLVAVSALLYHALVYRTVNSWDTATETPWGAKITGCFSILLWLGIIAAGRWIAYY